VVQQRGNFSARMILFPHEKKHERENATKESKTMGRNVPYLYDIIDA
jgi:hypothetical protein